MIIIGTIILVIAILYLFWMAFNMTTKDAMSSLIFKFIPFLIGLGLLFVTVARLGWLVI